MLSSTSLKFSALALGLMWMVGCQSLSTSPTPGSTSRATKPAEATVTTSSERAQTSTQQQAEDAMITVHLAQLQNGPELLTVDLGDDKSSTLYRYQSSIVAIWKASRLSPLKTVKLLLSSI